MIEGAIASHRRFFETLDKLEEGNPRSPSRLAGWSVGHVLTHIARNADSFVRIMEAAGRGESVEQYPGGRTQRAEDIEAGAGRSSGELVEDVKSATLALQAAWEDASPEAWAGHGLAGGRPWPCLELPFHRWREVEVHHVDLGLGYEPADWPEGYVERELPRALSAVPGRMQDPVQRRVLLAWLLDRGTLPEELDLDSWGSARRRYFAGSPKR
jgi:maleylpyruvate isomerase